MKIAEDRFFSNYVKSYIICEYKPRTDISITYALNQKFFRDLYKHNITYYKKAFANHMEWHCYNIEIGRPVFDRIELNPIS